MHGNEAKKIVEKIKALEYDDYYFEGPEASLELLVEKMRGNYRPPF